MVAMDSAEAKAERAKIEMKEYIGGVLAKVIIGYDL